MTETPVRQGLLRQARLERIASQERLDVLNEVTTPTYWALLSGVGVLLLSVIIWSILGSLPVKVRGDGMLIKGGEVVAVSSPDPGMITSIAVAQDSYVKINQVIAHVKRSEANRELASCLRELRITQPETETMIQSLNRQLAGLRHRETEVARLVSKGAMATKELLAVQGEVTAVVGEIQARGQRLRALEANCQNLDAAAKEDSIIVTRTAGKVIEVIVRQGDMISAGSQVITLEPSGHLQATVFIPAQEGKRVRKGMAALVSPSHIRPEEDGYMLAKVISRTTFPSTPEALKTVLRNDGLVKRLSDQGSLFRIDLALEEDGTPSGFRWTGKGPRERIESGAVAAAYVIVQRRRPISLVIPLLRGALGGG